MKALRIRKIIEEWYELKYGMNYDSFYPDCLERIRPITRRYKEAKKQLAKLELKASNSYHK